MEINWTLGLLGALGGALPDVLRLIKNRYVLNEEPYWKHPKFWLGFGCMVLLGGLLGGFLAVRVREALALGYGGPEFLTRALSTNTPKAGEGQEVFYYEETADARPVFSLRSYWRT